jgi:phosphoribosylformimino-5-aminoimidazole carboxamide ribotide isomerase
VIVIPAVDVLDGRAVRLLRGDYNRVTETRGDPVALARAWAATGARLIHVVDLDGARTGERVNGAVIERLCRAVTVPVEVGGGLRTAEAVAAVLEGGAARAVLGTAALKDRRLLREVLETWGQRIVVGIDARDGYVATEGWREDSDRPATELVREVVALGACHIIYTDIARDGALGGPNLAALRQMIEAAGVPVIASGGVGTLDDLRQLRDAGAAGAIVGRALYSGAIDLPDAIAEVQHADEARDPLP